MTSRCRAINMANPKYVPVYKPKCCPEPINTDPRRFEAYKTPVHCRSEPLSHSEYLRRLKDNNFKQLSSPDSILLKGTGVYATTIWTDGGSGSCCLENDLVLPAVPAVHPGGHALDSSLVTEMRGANAGRSDVSSVDLVNRTEDITTLRRKGQAIALDSSFAAPAGMERTVCGPCNKADEESKED